MKAVTLVERDPHPTKGSWFVREWWGQSIVIGSGRTPQERPTCGAATIYPILGPDELLSEIAQNKLGRFVCEHQIAEEAA